MLRIVGVMGSRATVNCCTCRTGPGDRRSSAMVGDVNWTSICPGADHADGRLDITMVHTASRARLIRLFPTVFNGTHVELDDVTTARARSVRVESPGINAYADGDYACPLPAEISAVPSALRVLRPVAT